MEKLPSEMKALESSNACRGEPAARSAYAKHQASFRTTYLHLLLLYGRADGIRLTLHRRRFVGISLVCLSLLLLALAVFLFAPPLPDDMSLTRADLRLATWLGVSWSMSPHEPAQLEKLAASLNALQVDDVYVFVSYLRSDGSFNKTYDFASEFVAALRRNAPGTAPAGLDWRPGFY